LCCRRGCEEEYGETRVRVVREVRYANYTQRSLVLSRQQEQRELVQFQYTEWACYGAPVKDSIQTLVTSIEKCARENGF
jgi:hypothetical protein